MCGIAGAAWNYDSGAIDERQLARMIAAIHHRGPDDQGIYVDSKAALGHARLSIIDLNTGRQPISNEDGTIWVMFNGEIYNFRELRERLAGCGHQFSTATDTEAIVHLYEQVGLDCFSQLRGMFAIAIWDAPRERLVLARDRLGKKPLVYLHQGDRLAFASEIKALLELPGVPRDIDPHALNAYLSLGYVPHPRTIYRAIRKLPPGHYAVYERGQLRTERYWSHDTTQDPSRSEQEYCELVRHELSEAVRLRMISDVPLGAFLSGGLDSTIIVALMQQLSSRPIQTFSIRFSVKEYDEGQYAREASQRIGTEHHEFLVADDALGVLPELVWHFDEPFADSSAIPTYYLAKLTKSMVTVALTGDGGDEIFCGYERYRKLRDIGRLDLLPAGLRRAAARASRRLLAGARMDSLSQRAATLLELSALAPAERLGRIANVALQRAHREELLTDDFAEQVRDIDPLDSVVGRYDAFSGRDAITRATLVDQLTYLPGDILAKVDIASMAHGLECRSPFLDARIVDLAARMPLSMKLRGNEGKYILKRAFADVVPPAIVQRRKMGFVVPLKRWFREELRDYVQDTLLDPSSLDRGYFRPEVVRRLVGEHVRGERDHSVRLWTLLCFELWQRRFIDDASPAEHAVA